jgi:ATP-dependent protease HslVU (ClpYQ) ATPase subunit
MIESLEFRRVLHDTERRYLDPDAQARVYRYLATEEIPLEVTERAILEAVSLGRLKNVAVDAALFDCLVDALLDDCSFEIPETASEKIYPANCTLC